MKSSLDQNPPSSNAFKGDKNPLLFFSSLSNPALGQTEITKFGGSQKHEIKIEKYIFHGGSCGNDLIPSSSHKPVAIDGDKLSVFIQGNQAGNKGIDNGSMTWMSSDMNTICTDSDPLKALKITLKTQNEQHSNGCNTNIRVCTDCKTTTTPLWRSGPLGPKSLCNACGIRQRKARRAKEEAAAVAPNGAVVTCEMPPAKIKVHNKDKKSRTGHVGQYKKQCKPLDHHPHSQKKHFFKDFALSLSKSSALCRVLPQDDLEAAILLMELSCGLIHS